MDTGLAERIYVTVHLPYLEVSYGVPDPRGERFAPGAFRFIPGYTPRLYLAHGGDRSQYRLAAGKLWEHQDTPEGLDLVYELFRTAEGRRGHENALDSTTNVSAEFTAIREGTGPRGERLITDAILSGVALADVGAYRGATVTAIQTATERRTARFAALAAQLEQLEQGAAAADAARKYLPRQPTAAELLAIHYDPAIAEQHVPAAAMALAAHYDRPM